MGGFVLARRSDYPDVAGAKWDVCVLCGTKRIKVLVHFDSGSVAPTTGETITGATSTDTCVVEGYTLISGTFAGGDAVGIIEGNTPTGYDTINLEIFSNDENLNGSTSGANFATANSKGAVQISGRLTPDSDMVVYKGKKYCTSHFRFKFRREWEDDARIESGEGDRE